MCIRIRNIKNSMITAFSTTTNHSITRNSSCFRLYNASDNSNFQGLKDNQNDSFHVDIQTGTNLEFNQVHFPDANQLQDLVEKQAPLQVQELYPVRRTTREKQPFRRLNINPNRKTYL